MITARILVFSILLIAVPLLCSLQISRRVSERKLNILSSTKEESPAKSISYPTPLKRESQTALLNRFCALRKISNAVKENNVAAVSEKTGLSSEQLYNVVSAASKLEHILIRANMRLVFSVAMNHKGKGVDLDDLVYEGVKGLKKALERFDVSKGCAFSTYAYPWIKEFVRAALASSLPITVPRHAYRLLVRVSAVHDRLNDRLGRKPSDEELAEELGISMERFEIVRRATALARRSNDGTPASSLMSALRYDETTWEVVVHSQEEGSLLQNVVSDEPQPQETATRTSVETVVMQALATLPTNEARAVYQRLGLGRHSSTSPTYNELEKVLGISREAAKNLYHKGVRRLRRRVSDPRYPEVRSLWKFFTEGGISLAQT